MPGIDRRALVAGLREIWHDAALRGGLLTVLGASFLCAPPVTFCPVLVREVFHGSVGHFSVAVGALGVGGLAGAIGLLAVDAHRDRRLIGAWFAAGYGLVAALNLWLRGLPALFMAAGVVMTVSNASANTFLQSAAPVRIRCQAASLFMLATRGRASFVSLLTRLTVTRLGVREALLINGRVALAAHLAIGRAWSRVSPPGP